MNSVPQKYKRSSEINEYKTTQKEKCNLSLFIYKTIIGEQRDS